MVGNTEVPIQTECPHQNVVGLSIGHHSVAVGVLEDVESRPEKVPVRNENLENAVEVLHGRVAIELDHRVEGSEGFVGQIGLAVDFDQVDEEGWADGVGVGLEAEEEVVDEREVVRAAQLEDESEVGSVGMTEMGLASGEVKDLFGEERVRLGSDELLDSGGRPNNLMVL